MDRSQKVSEWLFPSVVQKRSRNSCRAVGLYHECQDFDVLNLNMDDFESFAAELDGPDKTGLRF